MVQGFIGGGLAATSGAPVDWDEAVALALAMDAADERNGDDILRCLASPGAASSRECVGHEAGLLFTAIDEMELAGEGFSGLVFREAPSQPVGPFVEAALTALTERARTTGADGWRAAATVCSAMSEICEAGVNGSILRRAASLHQEERGSERINLAGALACKASVNDAVTAALTRSDSEGITSSAWLVRDALASLAALEFEAAVELDAADAEGAWEGSSAMPEVGPIADWEVMAAHDLGAARLQVGVAQAGRDAARGFEESVELGRFVKLVAAARAAYWGQDPDDGTGTDMLAADLCRALAAFPSGRREGNLLGLAAAAMLEDGFDGLALEWLGVLGH